MEHLTQEEWAEQLAKDDNAVVMDVRTEAEVADGVIVNAIFRNLLMKLKILIKVKAIMCIVAQETEVVKPAKLWNN